MENKHTREELKELQRYPLSIKVQLTKQRVREWVRRYGDDSVYISFSGGKDSTVLLDIVREMYPDMLAVFVDTGLEYPEIREFVKTFDNVLWLKPEMNFRQVIEKYGYPFISKQVSKRVSEYKNAIEKGRDLKSTCAYKEFNGISSFHNDGYDEPRKSFYNKEKWKFLTEAPFKISHKCCDVMKKNTFKTLEAKQNLHPMTAQMASESINREKSWIQHGCNMFDAVRPISNPMSFWTEQDVLRYIKQHDLRIASVYGDVVSEDEEQLAGQMDMSDYGLCDSCGNLKTTGCHRTGCIFCGFGCYDEKDGKGRFVTLKETHPKIYDYIMRPWDQGGLGYKEVIDWINLHGNLNIEY